MPEPPMPTAASGANQAQVVVPRPDPQPVQVESAPTPPEVPELTLEDVRSLTPSSDFKPFMAQQVAPEVRNAAMKTLFADPHYNVMDGLDIYIDDYAKPDPLPAAMLRQMVSAQFLNLFADEPAASAQAPTDVSPDPVKPAHDHTHLQLQPDHAAPADASGNRVA